MLKGDGDGTVPVVCSSPERPVLRFVGSVQNYLLRTCHIPSPKLGTGNTLVRQV